MRRSFVYILTVLNFTLLGGNSYAQLEGINLNKYKLTDYRYRQLGTNLYCGNGNNFNNLKDSTDYKRDYRQNYLKVSGILSFSSTTYSRKYDGYQSATFGFGSSLSWFDVNTSISSTSTSSNSNSALNSILFSFTTNNRFYLSNDFFYSLNLSTANNPNFFSSSFDYDTLSTERHTNQFVSSNSASIQFGKGRIENVTDARLAAYILDDLLKHGRLSRTPSEDEVFEFADFITRTLNERVIDSRIKRINEYVAIDSFLVTNGLINKTDGLYFGIINDNWNYARSTTWATGTRWYIGISPVFSYDYDNILFKDIENDITSKKRIEMLEYGVGFDADFSTTRIKGLKWMEGFNASCSYRIIKYDTTGVYDVNSAIDYKLLYGEVGYNRSYVPNSRTKLTGTASLQMYKYFNKEYSEEQGIYPSISGSGYYYFSEKLQLNITASVYHQFYKMYDPVITNKIFSFGFNATLYYTLF